MESASLRIHHILCSCADPLAYYPLTFVDEFHKNYLYQGHISDVAAGLHRGQKV